MATLRYQVSYPQSSPVNLARRYPLIVEIVDQIQTWTKVELPTRNGCPWFLDESEMPDD